MNSREETVYDVFPLSDTQYNHVHGWSRISLKLRVIFIGSVLVASALAAVVAVLVGRDGDKSPTTVSSITTSTTIATVPTSTTSTVSE